MELNEEELKPIEHVKSFYRKAILIHVKKITKLRSYETIVAEYNHKTNKITVFGWYSQTTGRHINAFLEYYGFDKMTKKEMVENEKEIKL